MMKLSLMLKIMNSVDESWRSSFAESILVNWGYDEGTVFFYRSSANSLFIFKQDGRDYFLRCIDSSEKDIRAIKSELNILEHLNLEELPVVKAVKSKNNNYIEEVATNLGVYNAVVFEKLSGNQFEIDELTNTQFVTWGASLGKLHKTIKEMNLNNKTKRESWKDHITWIKNNLPTDELAAKAELERLEIWADSLQYSQDDIGVIHYDFELDNLCWNKDSISILDFDDAAVYWYAADIAYALRDLFTDGVDFKNPNFVAFVEGYKQENHLNETLLFELPMYLRIHNLFTFSKLLRVIDVPELGNEPEWLKNLRNKLTNIIANQRNKFERLNEEDLDNA